MGRRKNYPWDSRADKQMTNLVSGLLACLIVAPFAIIDSVLNNTNNLQDSIQAMRNTKACACSLLRKLSKEKTRYSASRYLFFLFGIFLRYAQKNKSLKRGSFDRYI